MKSFKQMLVGAFIALGLIAAPVAVSQLMYGNTFPFWTVNGPLIAQTLNVSGATTLTGAVTHTGVSTFTAAPIVSTLTASVPVFSGSDKSLVSNAMTGTGNVVMSASPTLTGTVTAAVVNGTAITGSTSLTTAGYVQFPTIRTVTADATVGATDSWVIANKAGTVALTLPDATLAAQIGRLLCVKTSQAQTVTAVGSVVVPLITASAGTAILAGTAGKWACMVSDGTNWVIMAAN